MFSLEYALPRIEKQKNGCWEWTAFRNANNYGMATVGSKTDGTHKQILAHRMMYALTYGEFDPKLCVLHKCDNPPCVNPEHLLLGTHADNMADMFAKGRHKALKHEKHGRAKLNWDKVKSIRKRLASGEIARTIAEDFGVAVPTVRDIGSKRIWR